MSKNKIQERTFGITEFNSTLEKNNTKPATKKPLVKTLGWIVLFK